MRGKAFGNILSNALKLTCFRCKFGYSCIGRTNVLVNLSDAAKFVLEIHEGSSYPSQGQLPALPIRILTGTGSLPRSAVACRNRAKYPGIRACRSCGGFSWYGLCGRTASPPRPIRTRRSAACDHRLAVPYNDRAMLSLCCQIGTALSRAVKRLVLGDEQDHMLGPGPDRPAITCVADDESGYDCSLSHARA